MGHGFWVGFAATASVKNKCFVPPKFICRSPRANGDAKKGGNVEAVNSLGSTWPGCKDCARRVLSTGLNGEVENPAGAVGHLHPVLLGTRKAIC